MAAGVSIGTLLSVVPPASAQEIITCSSQNNRRNTCSVPTSGRVRFVRQLSDASCRDNWGYSRNRIWVRDGCRAEFAIGDNNGRYERNGRNRNGRFYRNRRYDRNGRYDRDNDYRIDRNGRDDRYDRRDDYDRDDRYDRHDDHDR
ncbi:DUF3011 domain-containing protein [Nostoc sp. FACHB-110]|uniref:DUF3011 domain-containing protein n=1 Tax=Nostoc sp. FACHB-110 TaxID=2692834 RepID=UPI00168561E5|nr:DUF3011 domain-containing protein [Nostoc sp. FACHB-110]MBD2439015.1 DUF3011 domain-containing protein [Nostoc sp. FACHB-110]